MGTIRVGVSGWDYDAWCGHFYPSDLPRRSRLAFAAQRFDTLEVNSTFYRLPTAHTIQAWSAELPDDVVLALKGSRFITHNKRLRHVEQALSNYLASGVLLLGEQLGPVLWQLPASAIADRDALESFLHLLPRDTHRAREMARRHDYRVVEPALGQGPPRPLRHALEARHASFATEPVVAALRRHGVALVISHSSAWPCLERLTSDVVYVRLHGPGRLYDSAYVDLQRWAERIEVWARHHDVYVYFDNDGHAHAPRQATALRSLLGLPARPPRTPPPAR